jgi:formate/nitrite transporter
MSAEFNFDALVPAEMAAKAEAIGIKKAKLPFSNTLLLAILAGAFIGVGAIFATTVSAGSVAIKDPSGATSFVTGLPYGVISLIKGLAFSLGLILVIVGGAELFTGNNLIVMAFMDGKVNLKNLLRNWGIVYLGNFVGSVLTALIMFISKQYLFGNGSIGLNALNIGEAKSSLDFVQAIALGIMCNALVCMAVWMCYSARSVTDKILAIIPPIAAFVAAGFEHSIANMYFIPLALLIKNWGASSFFETVGKTAENFPNLTMGNFLIGNLLPVTIGNIIGGALMVGIVYWFGFLRGSKTTK